MATAKKTTKKSTVKRAPAKSAPKTKVVHKPAPKHTEMQSFHKAEAAPFFTFRVTRQTVYWLILCGMVLALGVWVVNINSEIQNIYDQIESSNQLNSTL